MTDHGPHRQPASDEGPDFWLKEAHRLYDVEAELRDELARLRAEIGRLRACLEEIEAWRVYELPSKLAADALRGETK